ncbi:hypothetical protein E2562_005737 [Oryza meyeriana var. granulata]|uniref:Uncharacterized protein n=1 Tax=Oryza meyeriana var. granulata TaxID=110450 RepID=A0A6G1F4C1_9ORYZ|nr:hypothetical protein E2562_005737 [Oryza meyeriana var. granulata]
MRVPVERYREAVYLLAFCLLPHLTSHLSFLDFYTVHTRHETRQKGGLVYVLVMDPPPAQVMSNDDFQDKTMDECCSCCYDCCSSILDFLCCSS